MAWSVYGDTYEAVSDLTGAVKTVKLMPNINMVLEYVRTWVIFDNNPGLTTLGMKIYSDNNGSKGGLLYTSTNTFNKADIITADSGVREIYFSFNKIDLNANTNYHFALYGTASALGGDSASFAWKLSFPDPVYGGGFTNNLENLVIYPYDIVLVGAEL